MTDITSGKTKESARHLLRNVRKVTSKKGGLAAGAIAMICMVWIVLPMSDTGAQNRSNRITAMVAGPVGISSPPIPEISGNQAASGEQAVLLVTNISNRPVNIRMGIRDASDFSRILVTTQLTLQPGEGTSLPYIEQENTFRSVIGIVACAEPEHGICGDNMGTGNGSVLASLSVVDRSTNATRFVVPGIIAILIGL